MDRTATTDRRREWLAIAFLIAAVVWPFARTPTAQFGDDDLEYAVPFAHFVLHELARGRLPTWNPATDGGLPLLAQQPWMGPIYPGLALFALLPDGWALSAGYAIHTALYAVGVFLLLRRLGCGRAGAWLAAASLGLGSDVAVAWNRGYLHHLVSVSWLPWPILAFESARRGLGERRSVALGALALGLAFLGGHTVSALQTALAFGVWSGTAVAIDAVRALRRRDREHGSRLVRSLGFACVIGLGGVDLAMVQLGPLYEMSLRGSLPEQRTWKPWDLEMASPWRKVGYFLPAWETVHKGREFVGITLLLLAAVGIAALASRRTGPANRGESPGPADLASPGIAALAFVLLSAGSHLPFFGWLVAVASPLGVISYPYFFAPTVHLGLAALAACGLDSLLAERPSRSSMAGLLLAVGSAGTVLWALRGKIAADPLDHHGLASSAPYLIVPLLALLGLSALRVNGKLGAERFAALVIGLALVEMTSYRVRAHVDKPAYSTAAYFHADDPLVKALSSSTSLGRIWHVERTRPVADWLLRRNGGLLLGYEEINRSARIGWKGRDYAASRLGSDLDWEVELTASDRGDLKSGSTASLEIGESTVQALRYLGVDRIVTDLPVTGAGAGSVSPETDDAEGKVHLYRVANADRFLLLDGVGASREREAAGSLSILAASPSSYALTVRAHEHQMLVCRLAALRGWKSSVDDERALPVIESAEPASAFSVSVPEGQHGVRIWYSQSVWPALPVSGFMACLLGWLALSRRGRVEASA